MGRGERRVLKEKGLKEENSDNQSSKKASYDLLSTVGIINHLLSNNISSVFLGILHEGGAADST